jgi:hypothetical protein
MRRTIVAACTLVALACGCRASEGSGTGRLPFQSFYEAVQAQVLGYPCHDGDWDQDFGDAAYYGPAFLVGAGLRYGRADYLAVGEKGLARDLDVIREANADMGYFLDRIDEVLMAALGVVETLAEKGSAEGIADVDALLDRLDPMIEGFGIYIDAEMDSYAWNTYGPTTVTAVIALLNLRYAELLKTPRAAERTAFGLKVIDAVDGRAWTGTTYRVKPSTDMLELYPNVSMILANATAYRLTGEARFRDRCLAVYQGIRPLKDPAKGNYRSPYSAATMGAKTDDYSTLSSQNYTMMALALLYEITGDSRFRDEIAEVAAFIEEYLWVDGKILHHWMDGRVAIPSDPEYFCTGCNLQFLFVALYAERHVFGGR